MIGPGSMVALKGHHRFLMVVMKTGVNVPTSQYRQGMADTHATVVWLDRDGAPHEESYPIEILEEVDGAN